MIHSRYQYPCQSSHWVWWDSLGWWCVGHGDGAPGPGHKCGHKEWSPDTCLTHTRGLRGQSTENEDSSFEFIKAQLSVLHLAPISTWQELPWRNNLILHTKKNRTVWTYSETEKLTVNQLVLTISTQLLSYFSKVLHSEGNELLCRPIWVNYF